MEMVRKRILFSGRVQGVGFRWRCSVLADSLRLTGTVRNLYDGRVEAELQGDEGAIYELISRMKQQRFIDITDCDIKTIPLKDERGFTIIE